MPQLDPETTTFSYKTLRTELNRFQVKMNWTGGTLNRHANKQASNSISRQQKKQFARMRQTRLLRAQVPSTERARGPSSSSSPVKIDLFGGVEIRRDKGRGRIRNKIEDNDESHGAVPDGNRHPGRYSEAEPVSQLDEARRSLLARKDWAGIAVAKPLRKRFPSGSERDMIGKRRRIELDDSGRNERGRYGIAPHISRLIGRDALHDGTEEGDDEISIRIGEIHRSSSLDENGMSLEDSSLRHTSESTQLSTEYLRRMEDRIPFSDSMLLDRDENVTGPRRRRLSSCSTSGGSGCYLGENEESSIRGELGERSPGDRLELVSSEMPHNGHIGESSRELDHQSMVFSRSATLDLDDPNTYTSDVDEEDAFSNASTVWCSNACEIDAELDLPALRSISFDRDVSLQPATSNGYEASTSIYPSTSTDTFTPSQCYEDHAPAADSTLVLPFSSSAFASPSHNERNISLETSRRDQHESPLQQRMTVSIFERQANTLECTFPTELIGNSTSSNHAQACDPGGAVLGSGQEPEWEMSIGATLLEAESSVMATDWRSSPPIKTSRAAHPCHDQLQYSQSEQIVALETTEGVINGSIGAEDAMSADEYGSFAGGFDLNDLTELG